MILTKWFDFIWPQVKNNLKNPDIVGVFYLKQLECYCFKSRRYLKYN
jgi:hypothetical protein